MGGMQQQNQNLRRSLFSILDHRGLVCERRCFVVSCNIRLTHILYIGTSEFCQHHGLKRLHVFFSFQRIYYGNDSKGPTSIRKQHVHALHIHNY
jgi:hypothetical protein